MIVRAAIAVTDAGGGICAHAASAGRMVEIIAFVPTENLAVVVASGLNGNDQH